MKSNLVVILIVVLVLLGGLYYNCSVQCKGRSKSGYKNLGAVRPGAKATGICADAANYGADANFVSLCTSYQTVCGETSTSTVVHQIDGEYGLNSDSADSAIQSLLANVKTAGCCNPNNEDAANCTGSQF